MAGGTMTPERLAEIEREFLDADTPREVVDALATVPELIAEVRRQMDRIAVLEKQVERFVAILSASETSRSMADTVDALDAARVRIAALETGLRDALRIIDGEIVRRPWHEEEVVSRLHALVDDNNTKETP